VAVFNSCDDSGYDSENEQVYDCFGCSHFQATTEYFDPPGWMFDHGGGGSPEMHGSLISSHRVEGKRLKGGEQQAFVSYVGIQLGGWES